jgi:hypothetical protein
MEIVRTHGLTARPKSCSMSVRNLQREVSDNLNAG